MTRDEAIKELKEMRTDPWTDSRQMQAIELAINSLRTGHWVKGNMDEGIYCSECKTKALTDDFWLIKSKFCPNCGARMDGDAE